MNKEERRRFVNNIEYIPYIQLDNEQKQMISDFVKDYDNSQSQLEIANKKLEDIKDYINYLVILSPNIGRFNKTIWGEELLSIIGDKQ